MKRLLSALKCSSKYHHGNLYDEAIIIAEAMLLEKCPNDLSLRAVARQVGVTPCALYRHFKDKQALLEAVAERGLKKLLELLQSAIADIDNNNPKQQLLAIGMAYLDFAKQQPNSFKVIFGLSLLDMNHPQQGGPFELLQSVIKNLYSNSENMEKINCSTLSAWAMVHGIAELEAQKVANGVFGDLSKPLLQQFIHDLCRGIEVG